MYKLPWLYISIFFVFVNIFSCTIDHAKASVELFSCKIQGKGAKLFEVYPPQLFHKESKNRHYTVDHRNTSQTIYTYCGPISIVPHKVHLPHNKPAGFTPTSWQPFVTKWLFKGFIKKTTKQTTKPARSILQGSSQSYWRK